MSVTSSHRIEASSTENARSAGISRAGLMVACLHALIAANVVQLAAAFANFEPGPPAEMVPAIAATAVVGIAALALLRVGDRLGYWVGIAFCAASMVGMGPHKLFMEDGVVIAPLALVGFGFAVTYLAEATKTLRSIR